MSMTHTKTNTKTNTQTKTNKKCFKNPMYVIFLKSTGFKDFKYDEESDHSNKAVRKTPEIESGHKVSEEVK